MKRLAFAPAAVLLLSQLAFAADPVPTFYTHESAEKLYQAAKYAQGEDLCQQAIAAIEKARGKSSPQLAEPLMDLATIHMRLARYSLAKQDLDRAEAVIDKSKPDQALLWGRLAINKGWRLYTYGETAAAQKVFEEARDILVKNLKATAPAGSTAEPESLDLAEIINNLALMYEESADANEDPTLTDQSRRMLLQAWQMRRKLAGDDSPQTAESLNNIGMHLLFNPKSPADLELALSTLKKALETAEKVYGKDHPDTGNAHGSLAVCYMLHGQFDNAEREIKIALPLTTKFFGTNHPDRAGQLTTLGRILQEQTDFDEAEKSFAQAVTINEAVYGKSHPNVVTSLTNLKNFYDAKGDSQKAQQIQKRIEKISSNEI